ncbi:MAG: hypothetical protein ACREMJ_10910 [Gemmatimonadales bacterium]
MTRSPRATRHAQRLWVVLAALAGCSDALEQDTAVGLAVVVLNAGSGDLTLIDATRLETTTFDVAPGTLTSMAARGSTLLITLGDADAVQVATTGAPGTVFPLATGSGATGVVFDSDSTAWVANPLLNSVTHLDLATGDTASVAVGVHPWALAFADPQVFVVNANRTGGTATGPGWLTGLTPAGPFVVADSIALTGTNPRHIVVGDDGFVYVVSQGEPGRADGRLSVVDPATHAEVAVINGLGEAPGPAVYHPTGRLLIASPTHGILEANTATRSLVRGPGAGVRPEGDGVDALALDPRGRVYAVAARGCGGAPGVVHVLSAPPDYRVLETVPVGACPGAAVLAGG